MVGLGHSGPRGFEMLRFTLALTFLLALACAGRQAPDPGAQEGAAAAPKETSMMESVTGEGCDYKTTELSEPGQVQITCPNGDTFVVRRGADGKWSEEAKSRAGTRPSWASAEDAAKALCRCG